MIRMTVIALLFTACVPCLADEKPNIIFIMADDMGYADVGCYGQKRIQTPSMNRLAAEGLRFTQFYSGSTVCAPARSCLMTGQHTGHTRVRGNKSDKIEGQRVPLLPENVTVAEVLEQAGYVTGIFGKWGLGEPESTGIPTRQGFDEWFGYLNQAHAHTYYPDYLWDNEQRYEIPGNRDGKRQVYSHHLIADRSLAFIRKNKDKPFFLYLPWTLPHGRHEIPDLGIYAEKDWPKKLRTLAAMITLFDTDVGRVVDLLEELGIDEKTVVFVCSDNGPAVNDPLFDSNGPLRGIKRDMYEGGIRVPMIVRWPSRIKAGTVSDQVWAMWDFLPTAAELAGVEPPEDIDGISMVNALVGKPQRDHAFLYWEFPRGRHIAQAVRMDDWKAVRKPGQEIELYNLKRDLGEENNVAAGNPDVVNRMAKYMETAHTPSRYWPVEGE